MSTDTKSQFDLVMKDGVSGPAQSAGQALKALRKGIDDDQKRIKSLSASMARLQSGTVQDVAASRRLASELGHLKDRVASSEAAFVNLGGSLDDAANKTDSFGDRLSNAFNTATSPTQLLGAAFSALPPQAQMLFRTVAGGVAIIGAFAAAAVGAAIALGRLALASADARRSELLHLEGLTTLRNMYGVAAGRASDLVAAIDRVSDASAQSRGEVSSMAEGLYRAGLRGGQLEDALAGLDIAQSVQGDRGAARFRMLALSMRGNSAGIRRLADDYRARLGPIATRMSESLTRQAERLHEAVGAIFSGVRIDGFLHGMRDVVSLLSQSTVTGRALRAIASAIFSPLFDQVGHGAPVVRQFFQGMVLGALRIGIVLLRVRNHFRSTFGDRTMFSGLDAGKVGFAVIEALGVTILATAAIVEHGIRVFGAFSKASQTLGIVLGNQAASWTSAGTALVDGLIAGITRGFDRVRTVVGGLGDLAAGAFRAAIDSHSPSRVFATIGEQIPRGLEVGIDRGSDGVGSAVERVAAGAVASGGDVASGSSGSRAATAAPSFTFGDINVHLATGSREEARTAARAFADEIAILLEGVGVSIGAPA